ncbi:MAG: PAS domain S-box protein [Proteobacteria bacterium]|nr:PAS domain S-box protein [Pseudomonadota bacterium]
MREIERLRRCVAALETEQGVAGASTEPASATDEARHFAVAFEANPEIVTITCAEDGQFINANQRFLEYTGLKKNQVIGKTTGDLRLWPDQAQRAHYVEALSQDGRVRDFPVCVPAPRGGMDHFLLCTDQIELDGIAAFLTVARRITEQRQLETALRLSEARFQDFAAIGSDWLWELDADLRYTYFSDRFSELTGFSTGHALGKTRQQAVKADPDCDLWRGHEKDLGARRPFRDFRFAYAPDDGHVRHWSESGKPIFDDHGDFQGYRGTGTDITAEVEAQSKAADFQQRFITAVEHMPQSVALYDKNDRLVHFNERYRKLTRGVEDIARLGETFENILRAHVARGILKNIGEDQEVWIQARLEQHRHPSDPIELSHSESLYDVREYRTPDGGTLLIMADITERQMAELNLRKAKDEAEFADRAKTEFLANMSHELRTPLNAVIGFSQILAMGIHGSLNEKQSEHLDYVVKSGEHLLDLISDILDISKIEVGRAELSEALCDVENIVSSCVNMIKAKSDEAALRVTTEVQSGLPALWCDIRMIKQILLNLLSNAVKFTPPGGQITVTALQDSEGLFWFTITDTGIGISADALAKAMSKFGQVDSAMNRKHQGAGLGLPLASSLTQLHGGGLIVDSQLNKGTTVRVWLPSERLLTLDSAS